MYPGIQSSMRENRMRSYALIVLFPILLFVFVNIILSIMFWSDNSAGLTFTQSWNSASWSSLEIFTILGPIILIRGLISFFYYRQIVFKFSWARPLTRKENPTIYNIVENLCISQWLPTPKIWILDDDSLNAFATWRSPKNSWIVFSRWLLNKLNKSEIEAVAAHELTHIINKDSLLMVVIVVFVGAIATLWQILIRIRSRNSEWKWNILPLIGIAFLLLWYLIYPFIQLAISRKREYLADAGSVSLTKDKYSMISALQKISQDPIIESIKKDTVAAMCIQSPFAPWSKFKSLLSTHPSIEDRIRALQSY